MPHPVEVSTYLSTYLGFEVYCDDIDVVDPRIDEAWDGQVETWVRTSTIGRVWWIVQQTYGYQPLDENGEPSGEVHHFRI